MTRRPNPITDTELSILDVLWRIGPCRVRDIVEQLYPGGGSSKVATVHSLLERLEEKGVVARNRDRVAHTFEARLERSQVVGAQIQEMADKVFEGSLTPIILNLVRSAKFTDHERAEIQKLIDAMPDSADAHSEDPHSEDEVESSEGPTK